MNNVTFHRNLTAHLVNVANNGMDGVNALERVILAAAVVGDHTALGGAVRAYAALTGGSANMGPGAASIGANWLTDLYRYAADGADTLTLVHHVTNALGHGDADGHLA